MTKRDQAKLDATAAALRELLAYASAIPCADPDAPAFHAVTRGLEALRALEAPTTPARKPRIVTGNFWFAVAQGLRMVDDSWGARLAPDVAPDLRTWRRAKLRFGPHYRAAA